jgi:predicted  nucleic acid-binding Zn-ribbon protein
MLKTNDKKLTALKRKLMILKDNRNSMLKSLNHTLTELFKIEEEIENLKNK